MRTRMVLRVVWFAVIGLLGWGLAHAGDPVSFVNGRLVKATNVPAALLSGNVTVHEGSGGVATDPWSCRLSDGAAFYTGAKSSQLPAALGSQTSSNSLPVVVASDQSPVPVSAAGKAASGAAVSGNPVLVGGRDTAGNAQSLATDPSGRLRPAVYSYAHLNTLLATTIKSGPGVLRSINIQYTGVAHSLVLYDNTAASGTQIAAITIPSGSSLVALPYNLSFTTGLTASFSTAAGDATVMYERAPRRPARRRRRRYRTVRAER